MDKIIFGTWLIGENEDSHNKEIDAIQYAIDKGITHIDTAEIYGDGKSETLIGEAIKEYKREKLYLISKVHPSNCNRKDMYNSVENSLKRLRTDYLDLYLLHWINPDTDYDEVIFLMEDLKKKGMIKDWGVSNFDTDDLKDLMRVEGGENCKVNQVLYNLASRGVEYSLLPYMRELNMPLMAYCSMAHGLTLDKSINENKVLESIADKYGITKSQILLSFLLNQDVHPIAKSTTKKHIDQIVESRSIVLEKEHLDLLDREYPSPITKEPLHIV